MGLMQRCASCGTEVAESAFQCPRCERLLVEDPVEVAARTARPTSLVRSLLEEPRAQLTDERPTPPPLAPDGAKATKQMRIPPSLSLVPSVIAALRLTELTLTPFEAWVVSMMDGHTSGELLAAALELSELEMRVVMQTLQDRKVIALQPPPSAPARVPRPPTPLGLEPALDGAAGNALQLALQIEQSGQLVEAARFLELAIAQSPDAAPLYNRLALVLVRTGDAREAERLLDKALELAPGNAVYAHNLAAVRKGKR